MSSGEILAKRVRYGNTFAARLKGLMFKKRFPLEYDALLLTPCNSVHTFFMRYPIDVLFLDGEIKILTIYESLSPGKICPAVKGAKHVLELAAGSVARSGATVGEKLLFSKAERRD